MINTKDTDSTNQVRTPGQLFRQRFRRNKLALGGAVIIFFLFIVALCAPVLAPYEPGAHNTKNILMPPSGKHIMGTDDLGRDVFSRILYGSRISLLVGFVAVGISVAIGIILGAIAGYYGGRIDGLITRFVDVMLCFPTFFLILAVIAFWEPSIWKIMLVIGFTSWMGVTRLVRAEFLTLKERDFIQAARALGSSDARIIFRHVLPNGLAPVLVNATLGVAAAILTESALSFLGIGVQIPTATWGNMLTDAQSLTTLEQMPWLWLPPGIMITVTVLSINFIGDALRDALDPRLTR